MSLFLDQKYLTLISNRLPLFKPKGDRLYNCRCILCGDSLKNRNKARGYFYSYKTGLRYKCHNCSASTTFSSFLKTFDGALYTEYSLEKFKETKPLTSLSTPVFEQPIFDATERLLLDELLDRLDTLDAEHEAVKFCEKRKIPRAKFSKIYFIDNIKNIVQLNDKYKNSIIGVEPRLIFPFYDVNGQLTGVTCRAIRGEVLRYITVKIKEDVPLIFGINDIDPTKPVKITEGPIDSLFIKNSIAANGTSLSKIDAFGFKDITYIYDNQPRNKEVCSIISKAIDEEKKVVIWPQNIVQKDINDMVLVGKDVNKIIEQNTFSGLMARAKFYAWRRD